MAKIFISYRRSDSRPITERIHDALIPIIGKPNVFLDVADNIPAGSQWADVLKTKLHESDIMLVIIGTDWAQSIKDRLGATDYVYDEVETGLGRGSSMTVVPILVNGMTTQQFYNDVQSLPADLHELSGRQVHTIREYPDFPKDIKQLMKDLNLRKSIDSRVWLIGLLIIGVLIAIIAITPSLSAQTINPSATPSETPTLMSTLTETAHTATATESPTIVVTQTPTTQVALNPTQLPTLGSASFPCVGTVNSLGSSTILRLRADHNLTARLTTNTVNRGQSVIISNYWEANNQPGWVEITDSEGSISGWLEARFITLSDTCPQ